MEADNPLTPFFKNRVILENFTYITATRAKCRRCKKSIAHTFLEDFTKHLQTSHDYDRIIELENRILQKGPLWKYIKLRKDSRSDKRYECVLCRCEIANLDEEFSRHTHAHDENDYALKSYEEWQLKYCKKRINQITMKCDICDEDVPILCTTSNLKRHMKRCNENKRYKKIANKMLLLQYGRRRSPNSMECKKCAREYFIFELDRFQNHINTSHKHIKHFEELNLLNKSCINLQKLHPDDLLYKCTVCQQKVSDSALLNHECNQNNNVAHCVDEKYFKYFKYSVRLSDYLLKCAVCPLTFKILNKQCHMKSHIKVCTKLRVSKYPTNTVWQYFDDESNTQAICKYCQKSFKYVYIERSAFLAHVEVKHFDTFQLEREKQSVQSWKYIKYIAGISACVLCDEVLQSGEFDRHMHDNDHDYFPLSILQDYEDWLWKYGTIYNDSNDLSVDCDICREKVQITYDLSEMKNHLKDIHFITLQQEDIEGTADPSFLSGSSLGDPVFLTSTQQEESIEGATGPSFLGDSSYLDDSLFLTDPKKTEDIEGAAGSSFISFTYPDVFSFLIGIQQEEGIEGAARSSSLAAQQQDVDMSGTPAKQRKID